MWNDIVLAIQNGYRTTIDSLKYIIRHPKLMIPTFLIKIVDLAIIVWFFGFTTLGQNIRNDLESFAFWQLLLIGYFMIVSIRLIEGIATMITLSLVKQNDQENNMSLFKALIETFKSSLWLAFPVILFWALVEFIIILIFSGLSMLLNRGNKGGKKSFAQRTLDRKRKLIQKMLKMVGLFSYPIIIWEKKTPWRAIKESLNMFKSRFGVIISGISFIGFLILLMWIPPVTLLFIAAIFEFMNLAILIGIFIYMMLMWSLKYLIETLFITKVYLWYRAWEKACEEAEASGKPTPSLNDIPKPNLLFGYSDILLDEQISEAEAPEPM